MVEITEYQGIKEYFTKLNVGGKYDKYEVKQGCGTYYMPDDVFDELISGFERLYCQEHDIQLIGHIGLNKLGFMPGNFDEPYLIGFDENRWNNDGSYNFPYGATAITCYAFQDDKENRLVKLIVPKFVNRVSGNMQNCKSLKEVTFHKSPTIQIMKEKFQSMYIDEDFFKNADSVEKVNISLGCVADLGFLKQLKSDAIISFFDGSDVGKSILSMTIEEFVALYDNLTKTNISSNRLKSMGDMQLQSCLDSKLINAHELRKQGADINVPYIIAQDILKSFTNERSTYQSGQDLEFGK